MNIFFLVEGNSTEKKVYPKFIEYFFEGKLMRVREFDKITTNNYFLLSGNGYPSIFTEILRNAILDINAIRNYQYLVLTVDADETSILERQQELLFYLNKFKTEEGIVLHENCQIKLIVQNRCLETWFLGNKKVYKNNPSGQRFLEYQKFYNVQTSDPELMPVYPDFDTHASFHLDYLKEMLKERNIRYTKNYPRDVAEKHYLEQLVRRGKEDEHLESFMDFFDWCVKVKAKLET